MQGIFECPMVVKNNNSKVPMKLSFGCEKGEKSQKKWAMKGSNDYEKKTTHW